jgi:hypothetical protein
MTTTEFLEQRTGFSDVMDVPMERYNHNDSGLVNIKGLTGSVRMHAGRIKDNNYASERTKLALSIKLP